MRIFAACLLITLAAGVSAFGQLSPSADWAVHAANQYQVFPNLTYLTASNYEAKLDIYKRRDTTGPQPTIIYMHGGFLGCGQQRRIIDVAGPVVRNGMERRER